MNMNGKNNRKNDYLNQFSLILSIILYAMIFVACVDCIGIPCTEENNKFLCDNGNCIWHAWRCDKENDCKDNSDEVNCENKTCNVDEQFRCANGLCVSKRWLCDGDDDCKDNSDEDQVMCSNRTCNSTGQDFQCTLGKSCISSSWVCDGEDDCVDGSDELGCVQPTCLSTEYRCAQGGCITNRWRCDGELDCEDGSDESGCPPRNCSAKNEFRCSSHQQCIPLSWKCDKDPDCEDGSDEHNCPVKPTPICPSGYFSCEFGFPACIIKTWKCDGEEDCSGGSDEKNCSSVSVSCRNDQFACDNHHCIAQSLVCNGVRDCNDASDEHDCKGLTPKCDPVRMYQCKDGTCISKSRLCNHRHDCPNGEDEQEGFLKCNYNECLVNNGNCSDTCVDQRFGYQCQCSPGFQLNEDGRMCDDTNECLQKRSVCMEMAQCINYKGGYKCECYAGYQMERGRCKPTGDIEDSEFVTLVFSNKIDIRRLRVHSNLKTRFMTVIADQLKHAIGLSLNIKKRQVFWTDLRDENVLRNSILRETTRNLLRPNSLERSNIYSVSMNRTDTNNLKSVKTVLSNHEVRSPISLAVDWVNDHLYWVDYSLGTVSLSYSNGDFPTTLLTLKPMSLRSIAIHPEDGIMFLTVAKAGKWLIMKCAMDGTDCMDVITENIKEPTSITIDYQEQRLFWLDGKLNMMSSCDFDGGNRRTVLSVFNYLQHPFGISIGLNEVYWTDVMAHSVLKCNKWTGNNVTVIDSHLHFPMDIHVDHPTAQPEMQNHCIDNSCQFMCIPLPSGGAKRFTCVCPDGYVMQDSCVKVGKPTEGPNRITKPSSTHQPIAPPPSTSTPVATTQAAVSNAQTGWSSGTKLLIGFTIAGLIVLIIFLGCIAFRWYQRRSLQMSMHFDNPVYRKTTTVNSEEEDHHVGIPRSGSQAHLITNEQFEEPERENDSVDIIMRDGKPQNNYRPLRQLSVDGEDILSQNSLGSSDSRGLVT